jgi:translation elongation factor EF-1alpha
MGRGSFKYAWWVDVNIRERERGLTLYYKFKEVSDGYQKFTFCDTPGYKKLYK